MNYSNEFGVEIYIDDEPEEGVYQAMEDIIEKVERLTNFSDSIN